MKRSYIEPEIRDPNFNLDPNEHKRSRRQPRMSEGNLPPELDFEGADSMANRTNALLEKMEMAGKER